MNTRITMLRRGVKSMAYKPNDLCKYTAEQLEEMDLRELYALTESWSRIFGHREATQEEIDFSRMATRIYITRRENLRRAAPEILAALEEAITLVSSLIGEGKVTYGIQHWADIIAKAKRGE